MNKEEVLILISRLFTGYGKTPGKEQLDEWVKQQRRLNWRADDMSAAIDSLISTQNRFPTIAEFRTAVQSVVIQRTTQSGAPAPKPGWLVKSENEWRTEDFEWWKDRFGSYAPQAKALIGESCKKGKTRLALTIAKLINEMQGDYSIIEASKATGVSVEKLRQAITSKKLLPVPYDLSKTPVSPMMFTREALEAAGYSLIKPKENLSHADRWERLKQLTSGNTFVITPPARVAASTFEEF
jgi:hypothetical protein